MVSLLHFNRTSAFRRRQDGPTCDCLKTSLAMASRLPRSLMEETYSETAFITTSQGGSTS